MLTATKQALSIKLATTVGHFVHDPVLLHNFSGLAEIFWTTQTESWTDNLIPMCHVPPWGCKKP